MTVITVILLSVILCQVQTNDGKTSFLCVLAVKNLALLAGAPNDNFRKNICSEDDLSSRIFETFVVKFLACLPLLGFSNI